MTELMLPLDHMTGLMCLYIWAWPGPCCMRKRAYSNMCLIEYATCSVTASLCCGDVCSRASLCVCAVLAAARIL